MAFFCYNAVDFNDEFMEAIAYYAYEASSDLAGERGSYSTFEGSKWQRGLMPLDTLALLEEERGEAIEVPRDSKMDWDVLREKILHKNIIITTFKDKKGKYGRYIGTIFLEEHIQVENDGLISGEIKNININNWLVENNYAEYKVY
jgi:hypothetical protein